MEGRDMLKYMSLSFLILEFGCLEGMFHIMSGILQKNKKGCNRTAEF